jgi:hypothetical protein
MSKPLTGRSLDAALAKALGLRRSRHVNAWYYISGEYAREGFTSDLSAMHFVEYEHRAKDLGLDE